MSIRLSTAIVAALLSATACASNDPQLAAPQLAAAPDEVVHGAVPAQLGALNSDNQPAFLQSGINSIGNPALAPATIYH